MEKAILNIQFTKIKNDKISNHVLVVKMLKLTDAK